MKTLAFVTLGIFMMSFAHIETRKNYYNNGQIKYEVEMKDGMFNGVYKSWYYNGQIKAEGTFKENQRTGKWMVYDSLGQLRINREYENNFTFETIIAKNGKGEDIVLPEKTIYKLERNKEGVYEYPKLKGNDVLYSKRFWRQTKPSDLDNVLFDKNQVFDLIKFWRKIEPGTPNSILFDKNQVFDLIMNNITGTKKLTAYTTCDFKNYVNSDSLKDKISKMKVEITSYRITQIWFFNSAWQLSESRIIGICPVIKNKKTGMETELFWIYYPELRSIFARHKVLLPNNQLISNVEDIFQFSYFKSTIYQVENIFENPLKELKTGNKTKEEAERTEMELLDTEHDLWISLTGNN